MTLRAGTGFFTGVGDICVACIPCLCSQVVLMRVRAEAYIARVRAKSRIPAAPRRYANSMAQKARGKALGPSTITRPMMCFSGNRLHVLRNAISCNFRLLGVV